MRLKAFYGENIVVCVQYDVAENCVTEIEYIEAREVGKWIDITEAMMKDDLSEIIIGKIDWANIHRQELEAA